MSDLFPTKTRLALLREVAASNVFDVADGVVGEKIVVATGGRWTTVTTRIEEMVRAGWVERHGFTYWQLTDAGRAILDGAS